MSFVQKKRALELERYFTIQTLQEISETAPLIANHYPDPSRVITGIIELLMNALEHGNLNIGFEEKSTLLEKNNWLETVNAKQQEPEFRDKCISITLKKNWKHIELTIEDEGNGFDFTDHLDFDPELVTNMHGRGIALAHMICFDSVQYEGCGNRVRTTVYL